MSVEWVVATIKGAPSAISLFLWDLISLLAGGPDGPTWRWVVMEEGLLLLLVLAGAYLVRRILGRGLERHMSQWGISWAVATPFAAVWTWCSFIIADAIRLGEHPLVIRDVAEMTWGLPMYLSFPFLAFGGVLLQVTVALALASFTILLVGHAWAG